MKKLLWFLILFVNLFSCNQATETKNNEIDSKELTTLFDQYYEENMKLFPVMATFNGDNRYNNILFADFTDSFRDTLKNYYNKYLEQLGTVSRENLNSNDAISVDILESDLKMNLERLNHKDNYIPANQFSSLQLSVGQLAGGESSQPFKTVQDYKNWLERINGFANWVDSAIVYYKRGISAGIVLPKPLAQQMIPQLRAIVTTNVQENLFYTPLKKFSCRFY